MITICLYLSILNFVALLNYGYSLYTQMKFTISPDSMMQRAFSELNRKLMKACQF